MRRNVTIHKPDERPDVQILIEARGWVAGEVRQQCQDENGHWWAEVQYRSPKRNSSMIDTFPADQVRRDQTDYSAGRSPQTAKDKR